MKEINNVERKLKGDSRRLDAYQYYKKYEVMLTEYNRPKQTGIELVRNLASVFKRAGKIAEENGFTLEEYEAFCEKIEELQSDNPEIKLNDLSTAEGRNVIGNIISDTQKNIGDFKTADLDSVAVAKYYGLYKAMDEAKGKTTNEVVSILRENQVPISMYEKAGKKLESYDKNSKRELYDGFRKQKSQDIVHMTAAALEIGPGEAESSLKAFEVIPGKEKIRDFDKSLQVKYDHDLYQSFYDMIERSTKNVDKIIYDDRLTDNQKRLMIAEQQRIIERTQDQIESIKSERAERATVIGIATRRQSREDSREIG